MIKLRFWLSSVLIRWGTNMIPDKQCREWVRYGMYVAGEGIERSISEE